MTSWLKGLIVAGLVLGASLIVLGLLARWWPVLDIVNNTLPFAAAGAVLILGLAAFTRDWRLILPAALLAAVNVMLVIGAWQGAAMDAAPGSQRFMRVVTFNLWRGNDRIDDVVKFLAAAEADAVVLQEVTREHGTMLRQALQSLYPFSLGESSIVILSKHPILAEGRIDRPGFPSWNSLMLR
jgi:endonuclease/exonuclease/phosphatase (EEP) superfamily protein YafD